MLGGEADTYDKNIVDDEFVIVQFAKIKLNVHFVGEAKGSIDDGDISSYL